MDSKRITVKSKNPNKLFKTWLKEWIDEAERKNKKIGKVYRKALDSLNKYPLTLFSGHDCAILENIGPKICQMLDEKLEKHLGEQRDINQKLCYKDKISEVQRGEREKLTDLISSVEAACLTDQSFAQPTLHDIDEDKDEDVEMEDASFKIDFPTADNEQENIEPDVEIPEDLISSSDESCEDDLEDSLDELVRKYDPEAANKRKKDKRKPETVIKRMKKTLVATNDECVVDLSHSPLSSPHKGMINSPLSTIAKGGTRLKKFRTFDSGKNLLAGPSYASSPISKFLDVETTKQSPVLASKHEDDEFERLMAKYDFPSPIPQEKSPVKLVKKPSKTKLKAAREAPSKLKTIEENPTITSEKTSRLPTTGYELVEKVPPPIQSVTQATATQSVAEDQDECDFQYISIDDINSNDYKVILLVDIGETSG